MLINQAKQSSKRKTRWIRQRIDFCSEWREKKKKKKKKKRNEKRGEKKRPAKLRRHFIADLSNISARCTTGSAENNAPWQLPAASEAGWEVFSRHITFLKTPLANA